MPPLLPLLSRRTLLATAAGAALAPALPGDAVAAQGLAEGTAFDFDALATQMQARSAGDYAPPERLEGFAGELDYDGWRRIRFDPDATRWHRGPGRAFGLQAFHPGWLFGDPVRLYDVTDGNVREMIFAADDFLYDPEMAQPDPGPLPGVAGFRLLWPLNTPDRQDEVAAFLGASYFRALGQGSTYGISARGLALDTALGGAEEFPRFTAFYLQRPAEGEEAVTFFAALDSPRVTGAYRFVLRPGPATAMDVTARLFFRGDVDHVGVAPLTSMFLYDAKNRAGFDDFRPRVHDSEGLAVLGVDGVPLWRPLNNPDRLANTFLTDPVARFGLHQRDRSFDSYLDTEARYDRRPSLDVVPLGDWGPGAVRLVEIPTALETNDNIVAFFVPGDGSAAAGEARSYAYRLLWGDLAGAAGDGLARVTATSAGHGGFAGVEPVPDLRKFVVVFAGPGLPASDTPARPEAVVTCERGEVRGQVLDALPDGTSWRLVLDVHAPPGSVVELTAHLAGGAQRLTETWVYQWVHAA
ncbi:MAG TPA: glucan biosynthesis protein G [Paracoccaceae bacterium]|nr:glucan biosynthesis protein G [Paracoccaceae bacterium]HMO72785.1 glucan biosynthesis protein G [Paracoccaceae bacterium]